MLTGVLIRLFVPEHEQTTKAAVRLRYGHLASIAGGVSNFLLFAVTLIIGLLSESIAVSASAVNFLSDCGASIMMLVGFTMAAKPADNEHPFGHGRIEYVVGLIISVLIITVGLNFLKESFMRVIHPVEVHVDNIMIWILSGTLLVKFWQMLFYRRIGRLIKSEVIMAESFDSLSDFMTMLLVIAAVIIGRYTKFPVNGVAGVIVAGVVIWGGWGILRKTLSPLLGERPNPELVAELTRRLLACPGITGIHNLMIHNYGPERYFATAHAEVDGHDGVVSLHDTLENAEIEIAKTMPVKLLLQCDPFAVSDDPVVNLWHTRMAEVINNFDVNFKMYDFRLKDDSSDPELRFSLLIPRNYALTEEEITTKLLTNIRHYNTKATLKIDFFNSYI